MKGLPVSLALAGMFFTLNSPALPLDNVQLWTGSGTNEAALVIEWSTPESFTNSAVPAPVADKTMVWGYRFNGTNAVGTDMLKAIAAADSRLYVVVSESYGTFVEAIGYNLNGAGPIGLTDGANTNFITSGFLTNATVDIDAAVPLNPGDLYWGGDLGPNWETWNELNDEGGLTNSPVRGTNQYWTPYDASEPYAGAHGQWEYAQAGLDGLPLTNGSWIGFSVAAGEYEPDPDAPYNAHKHAPVSPDGTYAAYVIDTNDFATTLMDSSNVYTTAPYNDPAAVLGSSTLKFIDHFTPRQTSIVHRSKIVEPPYWTDPSSNDVITEISTGGEITVKMGCKIYDDPNNPYGIDLILYGNSFFTAAGYAGSEVNDFTDEGTVRIPGSYTNVFGHPTTLSVSQDGTNWFTYPTVQTIFPSDAYRWDDTNHCWTDEEMNQTKPLNPALTFPANTTVAGALDLYANACGGTGYDLKDSGFPWIQYVRFEATSDTYTVIDAVAAAHPVAVGDAISFLPGNLTAGVTNLNFQKPSNLAENLVSLGFSSLTGAARVSAVSLSEFSSYAPVPGVVSAAYKIAVKSPTNTGPVSCTASLGLRAADDYTGDGSDLRVYRWMGTNWCNTAFQFCPATSEAILPGVTNFSTYVVSQFIPPQLSIQTTTNSLAIQFVPIPNCPATVEQSEDLIHWTPVYSFTPSNAVPVTVSPCPASTQGFYRIVVQPQ